MKDARCLRFIKTNRWNVDEQNKISGDWRLATGATQPSVFIKHQFVWVFVLDHLLPSSLIALLALYIYIHVHTPRRSAPVRQIALDSLRLLTKIKIIIDLQGRPRRIVRNPKSPVRLRVPLNFLTSRSIHRFRRRSSWCFMRIDMHSQSSDLCPPPWERVIAICDLITSGPTTIACPAGCPA